MFISKLKCSKLTIPKAFLSTINKNLLKVNEFFSVCSQIIMHSGKIIREAQNLPKILDKSNEKGEDQPVTEFDIKVQTLITESLRKNWPKMTIIGEEDDAPKIAFDFGFESLNKNLIPQNLFERNGSFEIDISKAIVWVDPLDGTKEFIKGDLECVTSLIGISVENNAHVGVIGKFFEKTANGKYNWNPRCYFACSSYPCLYYIDFLNGFQIKEMKPSLVRDQEKVVICTTSSHFSRDLEQDIQKLDPDEVKFIDCRKGGAGNKVLAMIEGKADCLFYPRPGMKKWDICAGEAILKSVGGVVTDGANEPIKYEKERNTWLCHRGVIASISNQKHAQITNKLLSKIPKSDNDSIFLSYLS